MKEAKFRSVASFEQKMPSEVFNSTFYRVYRLSDCPMRAPGLNAPLTWFLISALCIVLLVYITFFRTYFSSFFPYLSPPLRIVSFRTDPLRFQAGCCKRRLNLALVFLWLFSAVLHFFDWWMRVFVALGLVFSIPSQETGLGNVSEMTYFVSGGT